MVYPKYPQWCMAPMKSIPTALGDTTGSRYKTWQCMQQEKDTQNATSRRKIGISPPDRLGKSLPEIRTPVLNLRAFRRWFGSIPAYAARRQATTSLLTMFHSGLTIVCLGWVSLTAKVAGFVFHIPLSPGGTPCSLRPSWSSDSIRCQDHDFYRRSCSLKMSADNFDELEGEDSGVMSFGAKAMQDRTNTELQEMVSSHNILAFIKVGLRELDFGLRFVYHLVYDPNLEPQDLSPSFKFFYHRMCTYTSMSHLLPGRTTLPCARLVLAKVQCQ